MEYDDLLRYVVGVLERLSVDYLVTGSTATIYFGEPRFTNDIDIVAALSASQVSEFCSAFPESEYYVSEEAALEAVRSRGQFNIIHPTSGLKVDVIVPADTPFDRSRFKRAVRVKPATDYDASFSSVEDVIIKKLQFYREGGSEKHLRDITGVLRISGDQVDRSYIDHWSAQLRVESIWRAVQRRASDG